jgi:acyl dehydratase
VSLFFEDLTLGESMVLGAYKFEREAIVAFGRLYDPQPFHIDEATAKASIYGSLIASGWHTCAAFMRCFIDWIERQRREAAARGEDLPPVGVAASIGALRWPAPVRPDDVVTYSTTILSKRAIHRQGWGIVTRRNTGVNQNGVEVLDFTNVIMTGRRQV